MNRASAFKAILMLAGLIAVSACQEFDEMLAVVNGRDVYFTLPAEDLRDKNTKFMLNGISVSRNPCKQNCGGWEMVRSPEEAPQLREEDFVRFPIHYGVPLPNMHTREHKALKQGTYSAMAGFAVVKNGKIIGSKQFVSGFTID